jgi:hypothetical protein
MYYHGQRATLEQKLEGIERFRAEVMEPVARLVG